jgi:uncharacterized membrane protein (UPF0127 family)
MKKKSLIINGIVLSQKIVEANHYFEKMKGLLFTNKKWEFDGMLFHHTNSIHTFFMNYPICVYYINSKSLIVDKINEVVPNRLPRPRWQASSVLEIPVFAKNDLLQIKVGSKMEFRNV